ncbi:MAG: hypothetical protein U0105_07575 [Candidatus Obscuribacterales bacterium]
MPQIETGDSGKKRDGRDTDHVVTSHKVAGESVSGEPMAPAYEPKFKSFSSVAKQGVDQVLHTVSQFCIEDKEKGKVITANGEKSAWEPRPSFMEGLRQAVQGRSKEEAELRQAEFSIAYMTRKAAQFLQDASGDLVDGLKRCFGQESSSEKMTESQESASDRGEPTVPAAEQSTPTPSGITDQSQTKISETPSVPAAQSESSHQNPDGMRQADLRDTVDGVLLAQEPSQTGSNWLNEKWIQGEARKLLDATKKVKDKWLYEESGSLHQVNSVPEAVISNYRVLLKSPKRDQGEFHTAIARKHEDGKPDTLMASPTFFTHGTKLLIPDGSFKITNERYKKEFSPFSKAN